ncbi:1-phosphofructokinase family hexose kinase [Cellulomonas bogoriensis]|uniref:Phosphofructokinase n=1 Tax=Cellulomonas bogoriensis 69B4 = DSM 16987 TaxID=1386082 RepID=A0A0A0BZR8_9CELL|nr:PfkB family carbohydrate kinase [Cellulomonas bogoriensis]KGM13440.1 phosphofructokinase [Cellulomonas bogoriensis 69B4 = DSM 16987]
MHDQQVPRLCVLAVTPLLTVTVEPGRGPEADVHVHAGGQGLWVARMARSLGAEVVLCGPFGGETGDVVAHLVARERIEVRPTPYAGSNGAYVHDRRAGQRAEVARMAPSRLGRHELDDLYGTVLVAALDADVVVLAGDDPAGTVPAEMFGRLAGDLRVAGRTVVADLSGQATREVLDPGVGVLKMSHVEMCEGGFADGDSPSRLVEGARRIVSRGVRAVVVSRAADATLVVTRRDAWEVTVPAVTTVEHRGAGDSMTAGIAVGLARGEDLLHAVRTGAAAGALNVTRRGLGTGRRDEIERFAEEIMTRRLGAGQEEDR